MFRFFKESIWPDEAFYTEVLLDFQEHFPQWAVQKEQLLIYWLYTYFCGAVYDERIFAKIKMTVLCTLVIEELLLGLFIQKKETLSLEDLITVSYRFSRKLEHSDQNLNTLEHLLDSEDLFSMEHLLTLCNI